MRLFGRRTHEPKWTFAEDVLSAVSEAECERLAELARDATALELGAYYGRSAIALASTANIVHSVDPHTGGTEESPDTLGPFLKNVERYGVREKVVVHVGLSTQVLTLVRPQSFDVVFVDAMHQRPDVDVDIALSASCLRAGGCLALHDYGRDGVYVGETWHPFGVTESVDEFVARTGVADPEVVDSLAIVHAPADGTDEIEVWRAGVESLRAAHL
jgi:predicted O-methyltransferase YrrM